MLLGMSTCTIAQNVVRNGNNFSVVAKNKEDKKTQYTFTTKDGKVYPIYLSAKGKAYILRTSSKTGKQYKQYLPEIGKQINPNAYK